MGTRIVDLHRTEVEHMVGEALLTQGSLKPGLVVFRVFSPGDDLLTLGQLTPDSAREIAGQLLEAAARAEYEGDFLIAARAAAADARLQAVVLSLVRRGEAMRWSMGGPT